MTKGVSGWKGKFCFFCGEPLHRGNGSVDHLTPLAHGGSNCATNKAYACKSCNEIKDDMDLVTFRKWCGGGKFWGETVDRSLSRIVTAPRRSITRMGVTCPETKP